MCWTYHGNRMGQVMSKLIFHYNRHLLTLQLLTLVWSIQRNRTVFIIVVVVVVVVIVVVDPSGRAVEGECLQPLACGVAGLNPDGGMDVCLL